MFVALLVKYTDLREQICSSSQIPLSHFERALTYSIIIYPLLHALISCPCTLDLIKRLSRTSMPSGRWISSNRRQNTRLLFTIPCKQRPRLDNRVGLQSPPNRTTQQRIARSRRTDTNEKPTTSHFFTLLGRHAPQTTGHTPTPQRQTSPWLT